jgi:hypothetical protein
MSKPFIFVSCGQYTEDEKSLGNAIVETLKSVTGRDAFFAEQVQDLNGLDSNILRALCDCDAFITVLHPRGDITRPDEPMLTRTSVWIEQEIAIATYIQRIEKRSLPVIAFIHNSVGLEGLRALLHLNPKRFSNNDEVLLMLPELLKPWQDLPSTGIRVQMHSCMSRQQDEHVIRKIQFDIVNDSNRRIEEFNISIYVPSSLLSHWDRDYPREIRSDEPSHRQFCLDEKSASLISPNRTVPIYTIEYCIDCAIEKTKDDKFIGALLVNDYAIQATAWIEGREYKTEKTIKELNLEAEAE